MLKVKILVLLLAAETGQQSGNQELRIQDPAQLVGKKIDVGRLPLCEPGTYKGDLAHAGMKATVLSAKPSKIPSISQSVLDRMSADLREMMVDQQRAATLLLQFEDGAKRDTCAAVGPKKLAEYIELAPGEALNQVASNVATGNLADAKAASPKIGELSDDEVGAALRGEGRDHWVSIEDAGLMAAQGNQVPSITLYMPEAVLAIQSESARRQFLQYKPLPEERLRSLMIVAEGYAGKTITEGCTSITRIVLLSDRSGGVVVEAYQSHPLPETWKNNFGGTSHCQALQAKFPLDDVKRVQTAAPNGEFFVAVFSGTFNTKMYKIKTKHQSKLRLQ